MDKVRWGMISAGNIAGQFARDMAYVDNAQVVAVAARSGTDASAFAEQHNIERAYEGYETLINDPNIDAIYISTPHSLHLEHSLQALAGHKAVLCEKPITTRSAELETLLQATNKTNGYVMEAMWTWFLPALKKAREWVTEGRIGELLHVNASFGFAFPYDPESRLYNPKLAGGCLLDMGIYPIAVARYFYDHAPNALSTTARFAPNGVENDVAMQFNYDSGVASLSTSTRTTLPNVAYIIGSEGYIRMPDFWRAPECHLHQQQTCTESFYDKRQGDGFEFQISAVSQDVIEGRTESATVTHSASRAFQADMDWVRSQFAESKTRGHDD
ncbi:MAG: Gfo/Idh/MocA family protein [Gammaproteobacteria bacterium]